MDMSFYTCAVGAHQQQRRLDVHSNNLANINNYGFKARKPSFSTLMTVNIRGIEEDPLRGAGSRLESDEADFAQNTFWGTERALDYAINGRGFFALLDPVTGGFSYTRDGSFILINQVTEEIPEDALEPEEVVHWYLSDGMGRYVLGTDGRPVEVADPLITQVVGNPLPIGIFDFINYNGIQSGGGNGFTPVAKNGDVGLGEGTLVQGYLELSNTDYAYEMAKVIESQRSFQYMIRMIQTSDEITSTVNDLR